MIELPVLNQVERLREALREVDAEVRFDEASRHVYAMDSSNYRHLPTAVVVPRSRAGTIEAVAACRECDISLVARGCGTSLAGQTSNLGVVFDFSKYLHRVLSIDPERRLAVVEPGCPLDRLRDQARKHGLTFGPDPATHEYCTLGGMLGNNSCGVHSVMAGRTSDNTRELEVLLYEGTVARVGATTPEEVERMVAAGGSVGEIYAGLRELAERYQDLIRERFPKIPRRVSGYNLDELLPENGFHVARSLVGTEGTCVLILEATLELIPWPRCRSLVVLGFPDVGEACDAVPAVMDQKPMACEGLDHVLIRDMQSTHTHLRDLRILPEGRAFLIVQFGGETRQEADARASEALREIERRGHIVKAEVVDDPVQERHLWEVRESGLGATAFIPGKPPAWPGWEDAAVPPERLGDYARAFQKLLQRYGYEAALYGHFGQGLIHTRIPFELETHQGLEAYRSFSEDVSSLVVEFGGSLSGEHGDGQARAAFLPKMYGPELMKAFRAFRRLWDPRGKMNPGRVVEARSPLQDLRLGEDYQPWNPKTHFQFPDDDHSFAHAALRCVGVGKCRRTEDAFMCPSYQVTLEEEQTTRGRARALFEMVRGQARSWKNEAVHRTLDLCLGCKGCKKECPVQVDMATYKSEFWSHYYHGAVRPPAHYAMGWIGLWARLARWAPGLANATLPLRWLAGITTERSAPEFAEQRFTDWFRRRPVRVQGSEVVLCPDVFNDCFHPRVLKAMTLVLERLGHRVTLVRIPALRPLIHFGFLTAARESLGRTVRALAPYARRGVPILAAEPSTISVFRDELRGLMPHDKDAKRIGELFVSLAELLRERELPRLEGKAVVHVHCHEKAVLDGSASVELLRRLGLEVEEPDRGCCGLAGAFGFEQEHYEISRRIGERRLLPAVRQAGPETLVVADGFSCRHQIEDGTGRQALHTAEVLLRALGGAELEGRPARLRPGYLLAAGLGLALGWVLASRGGQGRRSTSSSGVGE